MVTAKPSQDLLELGKQAGEAFRGGDDSFLAEHTGHGDVMMLGSAPEDEVLMGREAVLSLTIERAKQINEAAGLSTDPDPGLRTEAWEAGDTGWIVTHSNSRLADGATVPTRSVTIYARDDDGTWKAVFLAHHVLVPNDALRPESPAYTELADAPSARST